MSDGGKRILLTGNYAAAYAARDADPDVVSAYPITPQTPVIEKIADFIASGELNAKFVRVESEHSAMAALIGAASAGARTYTATSSQGLFYMYEVVWWAAGARLPIVMGIVTRALGPPWNIWSEHSDFYAIRDSGWNMFFASSAQEVYDLTLISYGVSENPDVLLPSAVGWDAFEVSHTYEPVHVLGREEASKILPPKGAWKPPLTPEDPSSLGNLAYPEEYAEVRRTLREASEKALGVFREVATRYSRITGRNYAGLYECYRCVDADALIIGMGSIIGEVYRAVDLLRERGERVGALKLWVYRPFPYEEVARRLENVKLVVTVARASVFGSLSPLGLDVASAITLGGLDVKLVDYAAGVGGVDVYAEDVVGMYEKAKASRSGGFWWVR
ncbi:pyruvate flavodoxin/ferredoxin oxidoreductase [Thermofilum pendens]|uniref:2-oxoacid oxidoreductase (ferredoxin) n=1 Tax=Thermofilum pendens (strain DSM 2475 / Hrk 5) TaxID=368408 RepID=A1RXL8_THEPD|nr:pyruvate flavodoxin/ferredoxin oxidoreductase [Thermofilum pendens]ABL77948.1 pyruvate flavodoxin/ferredoxin oxidoreductase domain protein [Thermofilum pendens Hrk 5]